MELIMKKFIAPVFFILVIASCEEDISNSFNSEACLALTPVKNNFTDCYSRLDGVPENYFKVYLGNKKLPLAAKLNFKDFCRDEHEPIIFKDSNDVLLSVNVSDKLYEQGYWFQYNSNGGECESFCLDIERAELILESDRFGLYIILQSYHTSLSEDPFRSTETGYRIFAAGENGNQSIFSLGFLDHEDNFIFPDTTRRIKYLKEFKPHGNSYEEVFTNEEYTTPTLKRKEVVYFSLDDGLVAVRDSLGVLWVRE